MLFRKTKEYFLTSIFRKLIITFLLFVFIPLVSFSTFSFMYLQKEINSKIQFMSKSAVTQSVNYMNRMFRDMLGITEHLLLDTDILNIVENPAVNDGMFIPYKTSIDRKINLLRTSILDDYLYNFITVVDRNHYAYTSIPKDVRQRNDFFKDLLPDNGHDNYCELTEGIHPFKITESKYPVNFVVLRRSYFNPYSMKKRGHMFVGIAEEEFLKVLEGIRVSQGAKALLITGNNRIILASDESMIGNKYIEDHDYIINTGEVGNYGWRIVQMIPNDIASEEIRRILKGILIFDLFIMFLFIIFAYLVAKGITSPIQQLKKAFKSISAGNLKTRVDIPNRDETGLLGEGFNKMAEDIEAYIKVNREKEQTKRRLEMELLYARIHPHFLFNTMNSIRWLADASGAKHVSRMLIALIKLLKMTISTDTEFITLEAEIENLKNYLYIQKMRYGSCFEEFYDIDDEVKNCKTLRLLLQPIVENAVLHGVSQVPYKGEIHIKGFVKEGQVVIMIRDNGQGIDEVQIGRLLRETKVHNRGFSNIGIANVNQRLKLHYGEKCSLSISRHKEGGTEVTIIHTKDTER